ncbi:MAG: glucose-1-phosphate cytidylyltransferase [Bacteriovoracia bacterium]
MKTVILCGGRGTRLSEETVLKPKPMVLVGERPMLWHIMSIYSAQGFNEFVLALGYLGDVIKEYFINYHALNSDFRVDLSNGEVSFIKKRCDRDWKVELVDTGENTMTGGRLLRLESYLKPHGTFMITYGDGVANVDLKKALAFHKAHGKLCTVTAVRPTARFGGMVFQDQQVTQFKEKPQSGEGWINGGFFIMEPGIFKYLKEDATVLEQAPLENLARDGQLMAYFHEGFWQCMDTIRERQLLEEKWATGKAPWKVWQD